MQPRPYSSALSPAGQGAHAASALWNGSVASYAQRVLLIGTDSVVSRALLTFLRKEGYEATILSHDPALWPPDQTPHHTTPAGAALGRTERAGDLVDWESFPESISLAEPPVAHIVVIAPSITGERRVKLVALLRADPRLRTTPILALYDAGDPLPLTAGGHVGSSGTRRPDRSTDDLPALASDTRASTGVDATLCWPFRLREIHQVMSELMDRPRSTPTAA